MSRDVGVLAISLPPNPALVRGPKGLVSTPAVEAAQAIYNMEQVIPSL